MQLHGVTAHLESRNAVEDILLVTGEDAALVGPLMGSLRHDLLPDDAAARARFGVAPQTLDEAIRDALAERDSS